MATDLEYTGLKARTWDALRGDTSEWLDRAFYLELIEELAEPVLDVGCGTGRLLLDFLGHRHGHRRRRDLVRHAVDPEGPGRSRPGLDVAGRVHQAAMETMALPRLYRSGSWCPHHRSSCCSIRPMRRAAMQRFHDHLESRGTLVMPWIDIAQDYPGGATATRARGRPRFKTVARRDG